jgi:hypothetical protein
LPVPAAPLVIVNHEALLVAIHAHPAAEVTLVLAGPPPATIDWVVGATA